MKILAKLLFILITLGLVMHVMKKYPMSLPTSLIVIAILFVGQASAQSVIKGTVREQNGSPLPYANVLLLSQSDSSLLKGNVTNDLGEFTLEVNTPGQYLFRATSVGYQDLNITPISITDSHEEIQLGRLALREDVAELDEIVVEVKKPLFEQKIDRTVVNVQSSITSGGGTALDVLEKSPGVIVDRANNSVALAGKQGVRIMINGKLSRMPIAAAVQMLDGINADNLAKVELITTPPAKYDAEGDAGFINIVLKQTADAGTNGSFSIFSGYGQREKNGGNLNFNHRNKKFNIFGDYSLRRDHTIQLLGNNRILADSNAIFIESDTESDRDAVTTVHNGQLGLDYQIGKNTVIGALFSGFRRHWEMDAINDITETSPTQLLSSVDMSTHEINLWKYLVGNVNISHSFLDKHNISLEVDYIDYDADNPTEYDQQFFDSQEALTSSGQLRVRKETAIDTWVPRIDYTYNINENTTLEAGFKGVFIKLGNDVVVESLDNGLWVADPELSQLANFTEDIAAAYTSLEFKASESITMKLGLRYEYTNTDLDTDEQLNAVDRSFGNLFPSFFLNQKLNDNSSWAISYSRRISRPTFRDIAPFVIFTGPNTFWTGNEALLPAITDAVRAEYRYKSYFLSFQYSHDQDAIVRFQTWIDEENNRQLQSAENLESRDAYSLTLTLPIKITDWWEMQYNMVGTYQTLRANHLESPVEITNANFNFNGSNNFKLPRNFAFEISGFYQSPSAFGISEFKALGGINLGLEKKLNNDGGTFKLSGTDIFNTRNWKIDTVIPEENLDVRFLLFRESQIVTLTYTRNFGNKKLRGIRKSQTGSAEEQRRLQ